MKKLLITTNNGRVVDIDKEVLIKISTSGGYSYLVCKPEFSICVGSITIGRMVNKCTRRFGHFLGMYIGDGWVSKVGRGSAMCIASIHLNIINSFKSGVNNFLRQGSSPNKGYHDKNSTHGYFKGYVSTHGKFTISISKIERQFMVKLFGHGAKNKTFPPYFLNTPEEFRWGLLSGLIDTDGSISLHIRKQKNGKLKYNKDARYSTISRDLAAKVQLLAFSLGVNASVTVAPHISGTTEYIVLFSTKHITEKRDSLSITHLENKKALSRFFISDRAYSKDIIPFTKEIYRSFKRKRGSSSLTDTQTERFRKSYRRGYISRDNFMPFYRGETQILYDKLFDISKQYELVELEI